VRLNPVVRPVWNAESRRWVLPPELGQRDYQTLLALQVDAMSAKDTALISGMAGLWIDGVLPNQAIRAGDHMHCDIGHETFGAAVEHWRRIAH
jgi:hypothetical protein